MAAQQEQAQAQNKINDSSAQDSQVDYTGTTQTGNTDYDNNLLDLVPNNLVKVIK